MGVMAHAYYLTGDLESGIDSAHAFAKDSLGITPEQSQDLITLRYTTLSVDDARTLAAIEAQAPVAGDKKVIIIAAARLFGEAQNALLKLFEEPSPGSTLVLIIPSEGVLLPTLRSRLVPLPTATQPHAKGREFLALSKEERALYLAKLVERSKADKDSEKQGARRDMLVLAQDLTALLRHEGDRALLLDLTSFVEVLHSPSAPIKLIAEHLELVLPAGRHSPV